MTSKAYQELGNNQPFDKLSEATRKTILYQSILEQVTANLGSTMQDTTAARFAAFKAGLADVRMALGQAFLPILYRVLPLLTMLSNAIFKALQVIAGFMRSLFGGGFKYKAPISKGDIKTTNAQADAMKGVGDAAEKAGKKSSKAAKKSKDAWKGTFGFDEVNAIDDKKDTADAGAGAGGGGGGGGGGLGDMPAIETPALPLTNFEEGLDKMAKMFDKYTQPIKELFSAVWEAVSGFAKEKFAQIAAWWAENGAQITQALSNAWDLIKPVIMFVVGFIWESIKGLISGIITFFEGLIEFFTGVFTGDWDMAWQGLKDMVFGAVQAIWNFCNLTLFGGIKKLIITLVKDGGKFFLGFADDIIKFFSKSWTETVKGFQKFIKDITQFFTDFGTWFEGHAVDIGVKVMAAFEKIGGVGKTIWDAIKKAFEGAVEWFQRSVITPIVNRFQEIKDAFKEGLGAGLKAVINAIAAPINSMIDGLNALKNKIPGIKNIKNIPHIPHLARGGITTRPTLAVVGDNRGGQEVISPLDRLQGMMASTIVQALQYGAVGGNRGNTGDIILNIDGRAFARIVKPFLDREQNRVGTDVRIRTI